MNHIINRNWKKVEDKHHEVEYINQHSGNRIGYYKLEKPVMGIPREKKIQVDTPSGYWPRYFKTRKQAMDYMKNFMREHPAGGYTLAEMNDNFQKSPLDLETNRKRKKELFEMYENPEELKTRF